MNDNKFSVNHRYNIVLWNVIEKSKNKTNVDLLIDYVAANDMPIKPSNRIMKMLEEVKANPKNLQSIILQYYDTSI